MMHDCSNGPMRDLLPLWVHGALPSDEAAAVAAHVAKCAACASEVRLIRRVALALHVPAPDAARIAAAVPSARQVRARVARSRNWRFAAAASFLLVASVSLLMLRGRTPAKAVPDMVTNDVLAAAPMPLVVPVESVHVTLEGIDRIEGRDGPSLSGISSVGELSDAQLRVLLADLETLDALPGALPDSVPPGLAYDTPEGGS